MKQWGSAIFPLSILFVLALLTFWLRYASELHIGLGAAIGFAIPLDGTAVLLALFQAGVLFFQIRNKCADFRGVERALKHTAQGR